MPTVLLYLRPVIEPCRQPDNQASSTEYKSNLQVPQGTNKEEYTLLSSVIYHGVLISKEEEGEQVRSECCLLSLPHRYVMIFHCIQIGRSCDQAFKVSPIFMGIYYRCCTLNCSSYRHSISQPSSYYVTMAINSHR